MKTVDEIVEKVTEWFYEAPVEAQQDFLNREREELIGYHHSLGRDIRNTFELWNLEWEPEIVDGVDESPYHPDAVSMTIIEQVWKRLNGNN